VAVDSREQATIVGDVLAGKYMAVVWRAFGVVDPDLNWYSWSSSTADGGLALNSARNKDAEIDAALTEGRATEDAARRKAAYGRVETRQTADLAYLWLFHVRWILAATNKVHGLEGSPLPGGGTSIGLNGGVYPVVGLWLEQ
jgi:ABC-type transport system substrate-binding protein